MLSGFNKTFYCITFGLMVLFLAHCLETTGSKIKTETSDRKPTTENTSKESMQETKPPAMTLKSGDPGPDAKIYCDNPNETNPYVCLMCNCFHEARGETESARLWVGRVLVTRKGMSNYPDNLCGVIWDSSQFSWTLSKAKRTLVLTPDGSTATRSSAAPDIIAGYEKCRQTTQQTLALPQRHYASHYFVARGRGRVSPGWRKQCSGATDIGVHRFFSQCGNNDRAPDLDIPTGSTTTVEIDQKLDWRDHVCKL